MIVVLDQDYPQLGTMGQVLNVKRGYALNFLVPEGIASIATPDRIRKVAEDQERAEQMKAALAAKAQTLQKDLEGKIFTIAKQVTKKGTLYGSVTERDIVEIIAKESDHEIHHDMVVMESHLKALGEFTVKLHLSNDVEFSIQVNVIAQE